MGAFYDDGNYGTPTNPLRWVMPQSEGQGNGIIRNCLFRELVSHGKTRPSQKNGGVAIRAPIGRSRTEFRGKVRRIGTSREDWCEFNYAYHVVITGPTFKASASAAHISAYTGPTMLFKVTATAATTMPTQYDYDHWSGHFQSSCDSVCIDEKSGETVHQSGWMIKGKRVQTRTEYLSSPPQTPFWLTPRTALHPGNPCGYPSLIQAAKTEPLTCVGSRTYFHSDNGRDGHQLMRIEQRSEAQHLQCSITPSSDGARVAPGGSIQSRITPSSDGARVAPRECILSVSITPSGVCARWHRLWIVTYGNNDSYAKSRQSRKQATSGNANRNEYQTFLEKNRKALSSKNAQGQRLQEKQK